MVSLVVEVEPKGEGWQFSVLGKKGEPRDEGGELWIFREKEKMMEGSEFCSGTRRTRGRFDVRKR